MKNKIAVIDIETTGFLQQGGSIVEVGIVEVDLSTGDVKIVFDSLCYEPRILTAKHRKYLKLHEDGKPIPKGTMGWIFCNSDITPKMVKSAPDIESLRPKIQDIIDYYETGITAFNKRFDIDFMKSRGFVIKKELNCPMLALAPIMNLPHPSGRGSGKWPNVEEAWRYLFPDVEYVEKHRGADDAKHEGMIVYEMYRRGLWNIS